MRDREKKNTKGKKQLSRFHSCCIYIQYTVNMFMYRLQINGFYLSHSCPKVSLNKNKKYNSEN